MVSFSAYRLSVRRDDLDELCKRLKISPVASLPNDPKMLAEMLSHFKDQDEWTKLAKLPNPHVGFTTERAPFKNGGHLVITRWTCMDDSEPDSQVFLLQIEDPQ